MPVTGGTNWTEIAGAFGFGAIASAIVTTYGGKGRQRRKARSKALSRLEKVEVSRRTQPLIDGAYYDADTFARLATACMIAGVPRPVVILYDEICEVGRQFTIFDGQDSDELRAMAVMASVGLGNDDAELLRDTLWRPVLTFPHRWWRASMLRRKAARLYADYWPSTLPRGIYRPWLREDKAERKAQGVARPEWLKRAGRRATRRDHPPAELPGQGR